MKFKTKFKSIRNSKTIEAKWCSWIVRLTVLTALENAVRIEMPPASQNKLAYFEAEQEASLSEIFV